MIKSTLYLIANENYTDVIKHLIDIAGGLVATLPSSQDFENPEEAPYLEKYLAGKKGTSSLERAKLIALTRELISSFGALLTTGMIHAEGSIEASIIELYRLYDYGESKKLAFYASGLKDEL
jgi:4-hydroxybutyryl-CoA dehydratase/vinylacetyl-CoA-Delta-isomerase